LGAVAIVLWLFQRAAERRLLIFLAVADRRWV
jgi:hypothetical protein